MQEEEMEIDVYADPWSEEKLQLAMVNTLEQWVEEPTRYRGQEVPSSLDLVFSKKPQPRPNIKYLSPMGRSDHVVLEINLKDWEIPKDEENHKNGRFNYAKGNFTELRKFFGSINWKVKQYKRNMKHS